QQWKPIGLIVSPAKVDGNVLALDESGLLQPLSKRGDKLRRAGSRCAAEKADYRHRRLLRARRERPRDRRAAECDQHFPPSDGDCHTPLPCEVRRERYHATSVLSLTARRPAERLDFKRHIFGRAVGRVLINAGIGRMSALGAEPDMPGWRERR